MSARTAKLINLRHQIDSSLAVVESRVIFEGWETQCNGDALATQRQVERVAVMDRECARAKQLVDQFIEISHA